MGTEEVKSEDPAPNTRLEVAQPAGVVRKERRAGDGASQCTGAPGAVTEYAKDLRVQQKSTNGEVVWIVATGRTPGIYMTAAGAKAQWSGHSGARHCAMNARQFEAGEHVSWFRANYGKMDCAIKPTAGRKRKAAADESSDED